MCVCVCADRKRAPKERERSRLSVSVGLSVCLGVCVLWGATVEKRKKEKGTAATSDVS